MFRLIVALLSAGILCPSLAATPDDAWNFKVYLDDKPVGEHSFRIAGENGARTLQSKAHFAVDVFIFNAYDYRHESNEQWQGDCLTSIHSSTDDNGEKFSVNGSGDATGLKISTAKTQATLPGCVMTFAYWNPRMLEQKRLINPQNGEYVNVSIETLGQESVNVAGKPQEAWRYRMKTDKFLIDLWYSADRRWLALDSTLENGRVLHYRIE
ncbi:MAG: DUF6134 family protein [Candidatus Methylumidiphilus sp.]